MMKILGWIIATPFIALALFMAARYMFCGPDKEVVKVATPMVQGIADYIVKHGVPESLADIEGLPYELEGCSHKEVYWKGNKKISIKNNADTLEVYHSCSFWEKNKKYDVSVRFNSSFRMVWIKIFNSANSTGIGGELKKNNNTSFNVEYIGNGYSIHHSGFCRPFKQ